MRNGWGGGLLCNVRGAYLFFLHSLMGKKKNCGDHGPPSHYVAPPLYNLLFMGCKDKKKYFNHFLSSRKYLSIFILFNSIIYIILISCV